MLLGWPDYLCLAIIAWGAVTGLLRGFVRVMANLVGLVAGLLVGSWGTGPVVGWLARLGCVDAAARWLSARLPLPATTSTMPVGGRVPIAWGESWSPALKGAVQGRAEALFAGMGGPVTTGQLIARAGTELLLSLAVFLIILAVVRIGLNWVGGKLSSWLAGRGLGWPDRLAGAVAGAGRNAVGVAVLAALAVAVLTLLPPHRQPLPPGGLAWTLAEWFNRIIYPWLLARLS